MPVGTGSIKRAAKANVAAKAKAAPTPEVQEEVSAAAKPAVKKTAPKKVAPKKPAAKKEEPKAVAATVKSCNEVCHLTEELPIHLL